MKQTVKDKVGAGIGVAAIGGLLVVVSAVALPLNDYREDKATPSPTPTAELYIPSEPTNGLMFEQESEAAQAEAARVAAEVEAARLAAEAEAARVAAEQEATRVAQEQAEAEQRQQTTPQRQAQPPAQQTQPAPAPAPPPPVRCPGGSNPQENDGHNDTLCMWAVCDSLTLPDPTHPECDSPFRP